MYCMEWGMLMTDWLLTMWGWGWCSLSGYLLCGVGHGEACLVTYYVGLGMVKHVWLHEMWGWPWCSLSGYLQCRVGIGEA